MRFLKVIIKIIKYLKNITRASMSLHSFFIYIDGNGFKQVS